MWNMPFNGETGLEGLPAESLLLREFRYCCWESSWIAEEFHDDGRFQSRYACVHEVLKNFYLKQDPVDCRVGLV